MDIMSSISQLVDELGERTATMSKSRDGLVARLRAELVAANDLSLYLLAALFASSVQRGSTSLEQVDLHKQLEQTALKNLQTASPALNQC